MKELVQMVTPILNIFLIRYRERVMTYLISMTELLLILELVITPCTELYFLMSFYLHVSRFLRAGDNCVFLQFDLNKLLPSLLLEVSDDCSHRVLCRVGAFSRSRKLVGFEFSRTKPNTALALIFQVKCFVWYLIS